MVTDPKQKLTQHYRYHSHTHSSCRTDRKIRNITDIIYTLTTTLADGASNTNLLTYTHSQLMQNRQKHTEHYRYHSHLMQNRQKHTEHYRYHSHLMQNRQKHTEHYRYHSHLMQNRQKHTEHYRYHSHLMQNRQKHTQHYRYHSYLMQNREKHPLYKYHWYLWVGDDCSHNQHLPSGKE